MKRILITLAALLSFNFTACSANNPAAKIDSTALQAELANKQAILIDVRTPSEYESGHVSTAILAPHDSIGQTIAQIAPNKQQKIYVHCRSGRRSAAAIETLKSMGYSQLIDLGGLDDLSKYGLKIDSK